MKTYLKKILFCAFFVICFGKNYGQTVFTPTNVTDLFNDLSIAVSGDFVYIASDMDLGDGTVIALPLIVPEGVTVTGNYSLFQSSITLPTGTVPTGPNGTMVYSDTYRGEFIMNTSNNSEPLFLFTMMQLPNGIATHTTTIQNIRIRGASRCWQDSNDGYAPNDDHWLSGGIFIKRPECNLCSPVNPCSDCVASPFLISHCEIFGLTYAGIFTDDKTNGITIEYSIIHHTGGSLNAFQGYPGIGYGIWTRGVIASAYTGSYDNIMIHHCIFDDNKDGLDGAAADGFDWDFDYNTLTQFSGGINKHNSTIPNLFYSHPPVSVSPCEFFQRYGTGTGCNNATLNFNVSDYSGGNIKVHNSIFHKDGVNVPYPWSHNLNLTYTITVRDNTFVAPHELQVACNGTNRMHGYARIADNYIEECPWTGDNNIVWETSPQSGIPDNSFSYLPGTSVSPNAGPQPPEFTLDLLDNSGNTLPETNNISAARGHNHVQYMLPGSTLQISTTPGNLGSQSLAYVVRSNPSHAATGNLYYDDQTVTAPSSGTVLTAYSGYDAAMPGLYGVDALAVTNVNSNGSFEYNASAWQHIPLIIVPPTEQVLIFNIKDSYQEFHHAKACGLCTETGVKKEVRLNYDPNFPANQNIIWSEDIADGGDGWERVEVDLTGNFENTTTPILSSLHTDGRPNSLSFDIAIDNPNVSVDVVKGVIVWIDDVYIKKYGSPDNLIEDGDIEHCNDIGGVGCNNCDCSWFVDAGNTLCSYTPLNPYEPEPDAVILNRMAAVASVTAAGGISLRERKSGKRALVIKLDQMPPHDGTSYPCGDYYPASFSDGEPLATVFTYIDFTDLLSCGDYNPQGQNLLGFSYLLCPLVTDPSAGNYYLDQVCILNNDITLESCIIAMGPNASITVPSGLKLTIKNNVAYISHLFACGDMWDGIINNGGTVIIKGEYANHNKIEDAETALYNQGGTIKVYHNDFKDNFTDVSLEGGSFPFAQSQIYGNNFLNTYTLLAKAPHNGTASNARIQLNNVTDLQVGTKTDADYANNLTEAIYGIFATNSSFTAYNNNFSEIRIYNSPCRSCTADIYGVSNDGNAYTITVGGVSTVQDAFQNSFTNSDIGILLRGRINTVIEGNVFNSIDRQGIEIRDNSYAGIEIKNNQGFEDVNTGIWISSLTDCYVDVHGNTFNNSNYNPLPSAFYNTAITIQGARKTPAYIYDNQITNNRLGIHANGVDGIFIGESPVTAAPAGNFINYSLDASPNINDAHTGIWLQSCRRARVVNNGISNNAEVTMAGITNFRGFDIETCTDGWISCNYILNLPRSMNFFATCDNTFLKYNSMQGYEHAINLDGATLPDQFEVVQGNPKPLDNAWNDLPLNTNDPTDRVTGSIGGVNPILWYYQPGTFGTNPFDPLDNGMTSPIINTIDEPGSPIACADFDAGHGRDERFGAVVGDSLQFEEYEDENVYYSKANAYKAMKNDTTIIYAGNSGDAAFIDFYNEMGASNIGSFETVNELASDTTTLEQAASVNTAINDTNSIEYFKKTVNDIYLNGSAIGNPLSSSDSTSLGYIAHLSPLQAGDAVYQSMTILGLEIHQQYVPMRKAKPTENKKEEKAAESIFKVFPNPANSSFSLLGNLSYLKIVEIVSPDAKLVKQFRLPLVNEFSIADITNGFYQIKLIEVSDKISFLKLSIIR